MKHFHGTPISGTKVAQAQVLRGRFAFVPWKAPSALEIALEVCRGVAVDCSAYSFWGSGEQPDWNEYHAWVGGISRHPRFEFAIAPDVIDGSEEDNDKLLQWWESRSWFPIRIRTCPVWHLHESLDRLKRLMQYEIIALGSSGEYSNPGSPEWESRMDEVFDVLCDDDGFPHRRIHGLRMLAEYIVERYPFYSADSTNVAQNGLRRALSLGRNDSAWGCEVDAGRIERVQSPARWIRSPIALSGELFG